MPVGPKLTSPSVTGTWLVFLLRSGAILQKLLRYAQRSSKLSVTFHLGEDGEARSISCSSDPGGPTERANRTTLDLCQRQCHLRKPRHTRNAHEASVGRVKLAEVPMH